MTHRCSSCSKCSFALCHCWKAATRTVAREDAGAAEIRGASAEVEMRMCDAVTSTSTARVCVFDSLDTHALVAGEAALHAVSVDVDGVTMLLAVVCVCVCLCDADEGSDTDADAGVDVDGEGRECAMDMDMDVEAEVEAEEVDVGLQHSSGSSKAPRTCD